MGYVQLGFLEVHEAGCAAVEIQGMVYRPWVVEEDVLGLGVNIFADGQGISLEDLRGVLVGWRGCGWDGDGLTLSSDAILLDGFEIGLRC